jgi:hypothetical protein
LDLESCTVHPYASLSLSKEVLVIKMVLNLFHHSGEIDVMEHIDTDGNMHSYLHYGGIKGGGNSSNCKTAGGKLLRILI